MLNTTEKKRFAAKAAMITSITLMVFKFIIGFFTGSLAVIASALDSLLDFGVSIINYFAIRKSDSGPTKEYRYGFGKIEGLSGLTEGLIITISGIFLGYLSIDKILHGHTIGNLGWGIGVMLISLIFTIILVTIMKKTAKETNSLALEADAEHYMTDIWSNIGIISGIIIVYITNIILLDPIISIIIAAYIIHSAIEIIKKSIQTLLDREAEEDSRNKILTILNDFISEKSITDYHELRTRRSGSLLIVDVHLVFNQNISLLEAHHIGDDFIAKIKSEFKNNADVIVHMDPYDDSNNHHNPTLK